MGTIINNKYYPDDLPKDVENTTAVYKQSNQAQQRKDHAKDLVQPHLPDGSINPQFTEAFPLESRERGFIQ